ncbi:hypothetical protein LUZ60_007843 [Juncus effusus]|nr:hypothetical protein LUZ60_007843 [Juncus effusus]
MPPPSRRRRSATSKPLPDPPPPSIDLISHLPDCLLSSILALLPIKDSARTSVLSRRWRCLWTLSPLHLDDSALKPSCRQTRESVSRIVSLHPGPIPVCKISQFDDPLFHPALDDLIDEITNKGIKELCLLFNNLGRVRYKIPLSLIRCETIQNLSLSDCFFPLSPDVCSSFPNVKQLTLKFVFLWDELFHCLLSSCSKLEELELYNCSGLQCVKLNCMKLRKLTLHEEISDSKTGEMTIENAPELECLRFGETTTLKTKITIKNAPKLESLGFFNMESPLIRIGHTCFKSQFQYQMSISGCKLLPSIKTLCIRINFNHVSCSLLPAVLRCFPCLETLALKVVDKSPGQGLQIIPWETEGSFNFLTHHLKYVTIMDFRLRGEVELVKFLILNGKILERITLRGFPGFGSPVFEESGSGFEILRLETAFRSGSELLAVMVVVLFRILILKSCVWKLRNSKLLEGFQMMINDGFEKNCV